ncbi:SCP2 sterol-binding domain-containing protein [Shewanella avicenniae]|uniref:Ubiquinone biosynthesis accessory factor UbiJ n=1 Tax=Shewanella avicenniae TaxID=2814294 RepID=A0ABX7QVP1_9GAMM|nr:SCP2 sterol-binding domain-containing protein [Shewanella avicenniae]
MQFSPAQQWRLVCCGAIETALAKAIALSHIDASKLKPLSGKVFCFELRQLSWPLYLLFSEQIQVMSHYPATVDVRVKADATQLLKLHEGESLTELIKQDKLAIEGDLALLQQFSQFLQLINPDVVEPLSRYIGDAPAYWLTSHTVRAVDELKSIGLKTWSHLGQLATEEYRVAPHKLEFIRHCDRIDDLVSAVDLLEQRIAKLKDTNSV